MVKDFRMSRFPAPSVPSAHKSKTLPLALRKIILGASLGAWAANFVPSASASLEDYQDGRYLAVSFSESASELKKIAAEAGRENIALLFIGTAHDENVAEFAEKIGKILPKENVPLVLIAPDIVSHLGITAVPAYFELNEGNAEAVICGSRAISYLKREYAHLAKRAQIFSGTDGYSDSCADGPSSIIGPILPFAENNAIEAAKKKTSEWIASGKAYETAREAIKKPLSRMTSFKPAHLGKASEYSKKRIAPVVRLSGSMRSEVASAIRDANKIISSMPEEKYSGYGRSADDRLLDRGVALSELIAPMTRYVILDANDACELQAAKAIAGDRRFYATALLANYSESSESLEKIANYLGIETFPLPASIARNLGIDATLAVVTARGDFFETQIFPINRCGDESDAPSSER